ncbi:hypothetical protein GYA19_00440 [Candidatus Beckwithbacteria bacterium]|nr:hypothetical protein [Candidatus Beckwithbacteria bacterium]
MKIDKFKILNFLDYALLLILPLGQLSIIPLPWPNIHLYLHDILIGLIIVLFAKQIFNLVPKYKYFLGFICFAIFSLFLSLQYLQLSQILFGSLYLIRFVSYLLFLLLNMEYSHKLNLAKIKSYFVFSIIIFTLFGFLQYLFFPKLEAIFALGWDRHTYRLTGTLFDPNFTGLILIMFLLYLLPVKKLKYIAVLPFFALLLTYSRSSFMAIFFAIFFYFALKKAYKFGIVIILILLLTIPFLPQKFGEGTKLLRTSTINSRILNLKQSFTLFIEQPIFGFGFNTLAYVKNSKNLIINNNQPNHSLSGVDNSLMYLLVTVGIFGTLQFLLFWQELIKKHFTKNYLIYALIIAIAVHGMFVASWFYPWVLLWGGIILTLNKKK